ncbi:hypothetical protein Lser_V15G06122 [Lactuca serriola]
MVNDGDFDYLSKSSKWDDSGNVVVESDADSDVELSKEEGEVKDCAPLGKISDEYLILQKAATVINIINLEPSLLGDANKGRQVMDASNYEGEKISIDPIDKDIVSNKLSYAGVLNGRTHKGKLRVKYIPSTDGSDEGPVVLPIDNLKKASIPFLNTLYGYLLDKKIGFPVIRSEVRKMWKNMGLENVFMNSKGDQNFSFGTQNLSWNSSNKGWTARDQNRKWNRGSVSHWNQQKNQQYVAASNISNSLDMQGHNGKGSVNSGSLKKTEKGKGNKDNHKDNMSGNFVNVNRFAVLNDITNDFVDNLEKSMKSHRVISSKSGSRWLDSISQPDQGHINATPIGINYVINSKEDYNMKNLVDVASNKFVGGEGKDCLNQGCGESSSKKFDVA